MKNLATHRTLLLVMILLLSVMAGCERRGARGVFAKGKGHNVDATVNSKAQTLSFKYDRDVKEVYFFSVQNYTNGVRDTIISLTDSISSSRDNYAGEWYTINTAGESMKVQITQNTSTYSRGVVIVVHSMPFLGTCTITQNGAK